MRLAVDYTVDVHVKNELNLEKYHIQPNTCMGESFQG